MMALHRMAKQNFFWTSSSLQILRHREFGTRKKRHTSVVLTWYSHFTLDMTSLTMILAESEFHGMVFIWNYQSHTQETFRFGLLVACTTPRQHKTNILPWCTQVGHGQESRIANRQSPSATTSPHAPLRVLKFPPETLQTRKSFRAHTPCKESGLGAKV